MTEPSFITAWVASSDAAPIPRPEATTPQDRRNGGETTVGTARNGTGDSGEDLAALDLAGLKARRAALRDRFRKLLRLAGRSWLSPGYRLKVVDAVERVADEIFAVGMELHRRRGVTYHKFTAEWREDQPHEVAIPLRGGDTLMLHCGESEWERMTRPDPPTPRPAPVQERGGLPGVCEVCGEEAKGEGVVWWAEGVAHRGCLEGMGLL